MSSAPAITYADVNRIVLGALARPGRRYWIALAILGAGVAVGAGSYLHQLRLGLGVAGINHPVGWGLYITTFVFWIGIAHSGTLISAILYLFRARWRLPIYRSAEAMTVFAVMTAGLFPLIDLGRVGVFYFMLPYPNERHLWPNFNSPLVWDVMAIGAYFIVSSIFLFVGLLPDLAAARDAAPVGFRRRVFTLLALGWRGSAGQFHHYGRSYLYFAALATALVFSVASIVSFDFAMALLPGWHSTIFAPYFVAGAMHSGLAWLLIITIPMRKLLRLEPLLTLDHLENVAKLMLLTTAIVGYFYVVEPFVAWVSGDGFERAMVGYRARGPYAPAFWLMVAVNAVLPLSLAWKRLRRSIGWLLAVSILVNLGMWFERFVIVVTATAHDFLPANWGLYRPTWIEIGILAGSFCLFGFLFLLFVRHLPPVSISETKAVLRVAQPSNGRTRRVSGGLGTGMLGVYSTDLAAASAANALRNASFEAVDVFAPCESLAIREVLPHPASPVRWWTLAGASTGLAAGLALPIWSDSIYALEVGAKPHPSIPSFLLIGFVGMLLLASLANGIGFAIHALWRGSRAPRAVHDPRFSVDRFGVWVRCAAGNEERARALLAGAGAEEIHAHPG